MILLKKLPKSSTGQKGDMYENTSIFTQNTTPQIATNPYPEHAIAAKKLHNGKKIALNMKFITSNATQNHFPHASNNLH